MEWQTKSGGWIYKQSFYRIIWAFYELFLVKWIEGEMEYFFLTLSFFSVSPLRWILYPLYKLTSQTLLLFQACLLCAVHAERLRNVNIHGSFEYWEKTIRSFLTLQTVSRIYSVKCAEFSLVRTIAGKALSMQMTSKVSWTFSNHPSLQEIEFKLRDDVKIKSQEGETWNAWTTTSQFNSKYGNRKLVRNKIKCSERERGAKNVEHNCHAHFSWSLSIPPPIYGITKNARRKVSTATNEIKSHLNFFNGIIILLLSKSNTRSFPLGSFWIKCS